LESTVGYPGAEILRFSPLPEGTLEALQALRQAIDGDAQASSALAERPVETCDGYWHGQRSGGRDRRPAARG
jgi:hypothetical protein